MMQKLQNVLQFIKNIMLKPSSHEKRLNFYPQTAKPAKI